MTLPSAVSGLNDSVRGIVLMAGAATMYACLDATAKYLGQSLASMDIVWLRYLFHVVLLAIVLRAWNNFSSFRTGRPFLQILRGLLLLGSTFFNFWALKYLQLAETSAIMFGGPLLVTALAGPLLGETVGPRRWAAVIVGFIGVLIVVRPGTGAMHWAALLSLCAMTCYAFYAILTRHMNQTERPEALLMLSALVGVAVLSPVAPSALSSLEGWQWLLAVMMGAFGAFGHYCMIVAHKAASASVLAPFIYTQVLWMITFGYIIFGDTPDAWTLVGTVVIVGAGLYILHRERVRGAAITVRGPAVQ